MIVALNIARMFFLGLGTAAKMAIGGALVLLGVILFYEGIGPWHPPRPISWVLPSIGVSGRVDRVRDTATAAADARCLAEKEASRRAAERFDGEEQARHLAAMTKQLQEANRRAEDARDEFDAYRAGLAEEDASAASAGRQVGCAPLGPRAARGLQRRNLPYPGAGQDPD